MRASFLLFAIFLFLVLGALNAYAFVRVDRAFELSKRGRWLLGGVLGFSLLGMIGGRIAERVWSEAPVGRLLAVASIVELAVLMSAVLLLLITLARSVGRLALRAVKPSKALAVPAPSKAIASSAPAAMVTNETVALPAPTAAARAPVSRRAFLEQASVGSAFLIGGSTSLYGALAGRHDYSIEEVPVPIPGLSRSLSGFTIVQLSDVHIGQFVGDPELAAAEALVRSARPDLIVLTGDLLDHDARLADRLGRFVRRLSPLAREGVVAISGNHDFYAGIEPTVAALRAGGARVLRNEGLVIGDASAGVALLGVDDIWAPRFGASGPDVAKAIETLPALGGKVSPARDLPRVLLCHNPVYFEEAAGRVALQLSGHTHGGQVNFIVRPADWVLKNGWVAGSYMRSGSRLYINRGFGTVGPPARVGAPPEITRIVLTA